MSNVIELHNVEKIYNEGKENELKVLKGINLEIKEGEYASIVGPSGSGKSTLMHIMGCLDRPTRGKVIIDGQDVSKLNDDQLAKIRREKIGFIFQQFYLIPVLNALENVKIPMNLNNYNKNDKEERARELLKQVDLAHRMYNFPNQLSGGEMQRVAIARALANNPKIILADEPTGNLDTKRGEEIINLLEKLNKEGRTIIIVTHDLNIAKRAKRKIMIKDGVLVRE
ncbi:MAG: ABC transporter ATP-binding protein [Candidatus Aenigmarchaeota archaeon]|nr:ABC transporter ATP-binding protein [Candidatus Aenigmarchaeota archaeon]MBU5689090.1 ABC transporter ATP-binding protein [Candidatus Aenigmarchaeota archaeon]